MSKIVEEIVEKEESNMKDILDNAIASTSKSKSRAYAKKGVSSIVKTKNCNRYTLSKELLIKLNNPEKVQVGFTDDSILIGEKLPHNESNFNVRRSKGIIYSTSLVAEISEVFGLDFTDRTSITLNEVEYGLNEEYPVARIKVK